MSEKFSVTSEYIIEDLAGALLKRMRGIADRPVILCVGSDRLVTDLLGPLVGTNLKHHGVNAYVYGDIHFPINATNLKSVAEFLTKKHFGAKILVVDSAEGEELNFIGIKDGAINFYSLPEFFVGDYAILAYNMKRNHSSIQLNQMGYYQMEHQANIITNSIIRFLNYAGLGNS